jgi:hypothetical protein
MLYGELFSAAFFMPAEMAAWAWTAEVSTIRFSRIVGAAWPRPTLDRYREQLMQLIVAGGFLVLEDNLAFAERNWR